MTFKLIYSKRNAEEVKESFFGNHQESEKEMAKLKWPQCLKNAGGIDFSGLKRGGDIPKNAKEGLPRLTEIACTPLETVIKGILWSLFVLAIGMLTLESFDRLNLGTGIALIMFLAIYFYYFCMVDIPVGSIGIPTVFDKRNAPWTKILTEGKHWRMYPFFDITIVDMRERPFPLAEFSVNAANSGAKKVAKNKDAQATPADTPKTPDKKDIVRLRVEGSVQAFVWDPWRILSIENATETLVNIVKDGMITAAQPYDDTELMRDKGILIKAAQKAADKESDHLGLCVKKILLKKIEPWNQKILLAHEQIGIETLGEISDTIRTSNRIEQITTLEKKLNIPVAEAIKLDANTMGNMPRSEVIVTSPDSILGAAAVLGHTLNKSDAEKKDERKKGKKEEDE